MAEFFRENGVVVASIHSETPDRDDLLAQFRADKIQVAFTVDLFNEGVDFPNVRVLLFLRPTESKTVFIQQLGRGLRWKPNKIVRVLDFVSDIRRIAALVQMEEEHESCRTRRPVEVNLSDKIVHFNNDKQASFFKEWLKDVAELDDAS